MLADATIVNCLFEENSTTGHGGAICMSNCADPVIGGSEGASNTFVNNHALSGADISTVYCSQPQNIDARWNTFAGHGLSDYYVSTPAEFDLDHCVFHLPAVEQDVYIAQDGDDENDGLSWATAFRTIDHAIRVIGPGESGQLTIHVGPGTFSPSTTGEPFPLPVVDHVTLEGSGTGLTFLDAEGLSRHFYIHRDDSAVIRDLTIRGGSEENGGAIYFSRSLATIENCRLRNNYASERGGAVYYYGSSPTLSDCIITSNTAVLDGGGIYNGDSSDPIHLSCFFSHNVAETGSGGGYGCRLFGNPSFDMCVFTHNYAHGSGGGISLGAKGISGTFTRCSISQNSTAGDGGGLYSGWASSPYLYNCMITGNISDGDGGGVYLSSDSWSELLNCTIANNTAVFGGGIRGTGNTHLIITDSILWGNSPDEVYGQITDLSVTYTTVQGGHTGEGNLNLDPIFITGPLGGFYLSHLDSGQQSTSPCVNSGSDSAGAVCYNAPGEMFCMDSLTTRTDHVADSGSLDMGYHYPPDIPLCLNHGDLNFDGELTAGDAQFTFMIALGFYIPTFQEACAADCTGDGEITSGDAQGVFIAAMGAGQCSDPIACRLVAGTKH